jgi:hypothetical protein
MSDNVTTALQVNATTGNGETLVLPEPRLVTFKITCNGPVSAGQITVECCPRARKRCDSDSSCSGAVGFIVWLGSFIKASVPFRNALLTLLNIDQSNPGHVPPTSVRK